MNDIFKLHLHLITLHPNHSYNSLIPVRITLSIKISYSIPRKISPYLEWEWQCYLINLRIKSSERVSPFFVALEQIIKEFVTSFEFVPGLWLLATTNIKLCSED